MKQWLLLMFGCVPSAVAAVVEVPAQFRLYSYDAKYVNAINQRVSHTITTDTNQLLLEQFSRAVTVTELPFARIELEMQGAGVHCTLDRIKTPERQQKYLFSYPVNFYLGYRLYQRADLTPLGRPVLNEQGEVASLNALFIDDPRSRLLVSAHFSLGPYLDAEIGKVPAGKKIVVTTSDYYQQFLGMFLAKRAEYAVLFPTAIQEHYHADLPIPVRSYTIAGSPAVVAGHLMCNKSAESERFLQQVNLALLDLYKEQAFLQAHQRYMLPEDAALVARLIRAGHVDQY
jgi:uncharacterized protein (TIGR02285 family)